MPIRRVQSSAESAAPNVLRVATGTQKPQGSMKTGPRFTQNAIRMVSANPLKLDWRKLRCRCLLHGLHVTAHSLSQLRIHFVRNRHDIR